MHTIVIKGNSFCVVHEDRLDDTISSHGSLEQASHVCNRLNGGFSNELAQLTDLLRPILLHGAKEMKNGR